MLWSGGYFHLFYLCGGNTVLLHMTFQGLMPSLWYLEIGHGGDSDSMEINTFYRLGLVLFVVVTIRLHQHATGRTERQNTKDQAVLQVEHKEREKDMVM